MSDEQAPAAPEAPSDEPSTQAGGGVAPVELDLGPDAAETGEHNLRELASALAAERTTTTNAQLRFIRQGAEVVVPLDRPETVIGRDPRCDIVLEGDDVSRRHACVRRLRSGYFELADLNSENGTIVQGGAIETMQLVDGDRFVVGSVKITVDILQATEESA